MNSNSQARRLFEDYDMVLPQDYQKRIKKLLGDDYDRYLESFALKTRQSFRVNQMKAEPAELFRRLYKSLRPSSISRPSSVSKPSCISTIPWCPTGVYYDGDERLSLHPYYHAGLYYIQEPSAMAPAAFLPVSPGDRVLDLCAAPGGKTTALGARLRGQGLLVANDISISRCKALLKNVQLAGIGNAMITCEKPEKLVSYFPSYFDAVLVDAPCSGEGMFRKDPGMMKHWSPEEVLRYSRLQKEILSAAAVMTRPGGWILYSTCTYSPEENEQVVETLLSDGQFELVPLPLYQGVDTGHPDWSSSGDPSLVCCRRFWNHRVEGEGQFAALLRKKGDMKAGQDRPAGREEIKVRRPVKQQSARRTSRQAAHKTGKEGVKLPKEFFSFLEELRGAGIPAGLKDGDKKRLMQVGERLFLLPEEAPDTTHLRVVSSGLHLGNCKKNRFEPGHALALALKPDQFSNVVRFSLFDQRVERYLRCETIDLYPEDVYPENVYPDDEIRLCVHRAESGKRKEDLHQVEERTGCPSIKDGWCLVCVDDYPLGWGKVSKGRMKNKYPPGWRIIYG